MLQIFSKQNAKKLFSTVFQPKFFLFRGLPSVQIVYVQAIIILETPPVSLSISQYVSKHAG